MRMLEKTRWKTVQAQWKHCERAVQASRSLKQKVRLRRGSGLYFVCLSHQTIRTITPFRVGAGAVRGLYKRGQIERDGLSHHAAPMSNLEGASWTRMIATWSS
jgi:hypothetical protein